MAEVKCESCRDLQSDYAQTKEMQKVFEDQDRSFSWDISISTGNGSLWEYRFDDARGDASIHQIAMLIKLFLDSGSYDSKRVKTAEVSK